jgi:hypothetical protein
MRRAARLLVTPVQKRRSSCLFDYYYWLTYLLLLLIALSFNTDNLHQEGLHCIDDSTIAEYNENLTCVNFVYSTIVFIKFVAKTPNEGICNPS